MTNIESFFLGFLFGLVSLFLGFMFFSEDDRAAREYLGIKCFKKCTIDTQNCHSNWYEIVWKDGKKHD